jgi:hypothetical protein
MNSSSELQNFIIVTFNPHRLLSNFQISFFMEQHFPQQLFILMKQHFAQQLFIMMKQHFA